MSEAEQNKNPGIKITIMVLGFVALVSLMKLGHEVWGVLAFFSAIGVVATLNER